MSPRCLPGGRSPPVTAAVPVAAAAVPVSAVIMAAVIVAAVIVAAVIVAAVVIRAATIITAMPISGRAISVISRSDDNPAPARSVGPAIAVDIPMPAVSASARGQRRSR